MVVGSPGDRAQVLAHLATGDRFGAVERLRALWAARPTLANAALVLAVLDGQAREAVPVLARARLAIERNHTVEPLVPLLRAQARWLGLALDVRVGEYDQIHQALRAAESALAACRPDLVLVSARGHLHAADLVASVRAMRAWSAAPVLVPDEAPPGEESAAAREARLAHNALLAAGMATLPAAHTLPHERCCDEATWRAGHDARADAHHGLPWRASLHATIAAHWLRWVAPLAGRQAKVVVTDLDDTLWPGVLDEGGIGPLAGERGAAHRHYQQALLELRAAGVLLTVASRNDRAQALATLQTHPDLLVRPEHFSALAVDWGEKSENIARMAGGLGLGLESFVFVDDSPVERERMRRALPQVHVLDVDADPATLATRLRGSPLLQPLAPTADDRARAERYRDEAARQAFLASAAAPAPGEGADPASALLASLELRVEAVAAASEPARIAQLTRRTNQFNLTGLRLDDAALAALLAAEGVHLGFRVADRFGDYGLVGAYLGRHVGDELLTEVLVLSCRALGRGVETRMLEAVAATARATGCRRIVGRYRASGRNSQVADLFARHGYAPLARQVGQAADESRWALAL